MRCRRGGALSRGQKGLLQWDDMMKFTATKNKALIVSAALAAVTLMSLATAADARPRHVKQRQQAAQVATPKIDDRYALVLQESKTAPQASARQRSGYQSRTRQV